VKKLIAALTLIVLVCCSSLVSANPAWAHDEPQEQWDDFWYFARDNPVVFVLYVLLMIVLIATIVLLLIFWLQGRREKALKKSEIKEQPQ
jgi:heme/copper-type cytochrome/quinol oxidase subunit 2